MSSDIRVADGIVLDEPAPLAMVSVYPAPVPVAVTAAEIAALNWDGGVKQADYAAKRQAARAITVAAYEAQKKLHGEPKA